MGAYFYVSAPSGLRPLVMSFNLVHLCSGETSVQLLFTAAPMW